MHDWEGRVVPCEQVYRCSVPTDLEFQTSSGPSKSPGESFTATVATIMPPFVELCAQAEVTILYRIIVVLVNALLLPLLHSFCPDALYL